MCCTTRSRYALEDLDVDADYCPSLTGLFSSIDGPIGLACEALAKASNFLWELELCAEVSDPARFGYQDDDTDPMPF